MTRGRAPTPAPAPRHRPVLLKEVMVALSPRDGGIYVDGTFGAGGYARALLESADCTVWGIDRDPDAIAAGAPLAREHRGRLSLLEGRLGAMDELLSARGVHQVHGVAFDLGPSSMQLDDPERGFSFRLDGPLDMRMDKTARSAADIVNMASEEELADIIHRFGEERFSRRIARAIVTARDQKPITRTGELARIVRAVVRRSHDGIDPATRTFQALRICVNEELSEVDRGLRAAECLLAPGGRLVVVSFHSLEDRPVKNFLKIRSGGAPRPSRHVPGAAAAPAPGAPQPTFRLLFRRAVRPRAQEIADNPRARSARLRAAERTAAPPWPNGGDQ
ncbi:MAG: 16S rRNA (cytosine(1402)-N(4))-methyltransferase RsmH [Alphaproteobacteria bacterium]